MTILCRWCTLTVRCANRCAACPHVGSGMWQSPSLLAPGGCLWLDWRDRDIHRGLAAMAASSSGAAASGARNGGLEACCPQACGVARHLVSSLHGAATRSSNALHRRLPGGRTSGWACWVRDSVCLRPAVRFAEHPPALMKSFVAACTVRAMPCVSVAMGRVRTVSRSGSSLGAVLAALTTGSRLSGCICGCSGGRRSPHGGTRGPQMQLSCCNPAGLAASMRNLSAGASVRWR